LALALNLAGCGGSVEQNASFKALSKRVKDLEDKQVGQTKKLDELGLDVTTALQDVANVQAGLQSAGGASPEIKKQLDDLAARLAQVEEKAQSAKGAAAAEAEAQPEPAEAADAAGDSAAAVAAGDAAQTDAPKAKAKAAKKRAKIARAKKAAPAEPVAPSGFYYSVQKGDTLSSVAQANGISSEALAQANHLPLSAALLGGQQIFVPKPKQRRRHTPFRFF
jgi:LysM repeat protein